MLAPERERLARRPSGNEVQLPFKRAEIDLAHIALSQRPVEHVGILSVLVLPDRVAAKRISLDNAHGKEAGFVKSDSQPAGAGEKLN